MASGRQYQDRGRRATRAERRAVRLTSCEDNEFVRFVDKSGREVTPGGPRYVRLTVMKDAVWKVSTALTTKVETLEGQPCAA